MYKSLTRLSIYSMVVCFVIVESGTKHAIKTKPMKLAANNTDNKPVTSTSKPVATTRSITVKNNITHDMLGYKKFGWHYPDKEFKILIDGKELKENQTVTTTITNNILPIMFRYEFKHIWRNKGKGTRRVTFKIPPTSTTVNLTFNWKTDSQVLIKNATFINAQDL